MPSGEVPVISWQFGSLKASCGLRKGEARLGNKVSALSIV